MAIKMSDVDDEVTAMATMIMMIIMMQIMIIAVIIIILMPNIMVDSFASSIGNSK